MSPAAKIAVLCASMDSVTRNLEELERLAQVVGEDALAHEAQTIRKAFADRSASLVALQEKAP